MTEQTEPEIARDLAMLGALLLDAGESVTTVRGHLQNTALTLDRPGYVFAILPTLVLVTDAETHATTAVSARSELTFRQAARANRLPSRIRSGDTAIEAVPAQVALIRDGSKRRSLARAAVGNAVVAAAFAALFPNDWWAIAAAGLVGVVVGVAMTVFERSSPGTALEPFVLSLTSTLLMGSAATLIAAPAISLYAVVAPLVILVPGAVIAKALLETTSGDIVSGSSRLLSGLVTMGFMVAGIAAGSALTGLVVDPASVGLVGVGLAGDAPQMSTDSSWAAAPPSWLRWVGVAGLAVGVSVMFQAGARLGVVSTLIMCAAQALTAALAPTTGAVLAIGTGSGLVFLAAKTVERLAPSLPAAVTFFPAFLLFVPGTLALVSLATATQSALTTALLSFTSLCVGTHVGGLVDQYFEKTIWSSTGKGDTSWPNGTH